MNEINKNLCNAFFIAFFFLNADFSPAEHLADSDQAGKSDSPARDARAEPTLEDTILVTAIRSAARAGSLAGSLNALQTEELEFVGHNHIQESLLRIPGVNFHRGNGQEYLPSIRSPVLSGAGACGAFLMAEDNIPLRAAGFCNVNELFEAHTEQARRIEVLRGVGTAFHGSNALHGIINVITPSAPEAGTAIGAEFGSYDYARLKFSGGLENAALFVTTTHDGGYRDNAGFDQQKLTLRHRLATGSMTADSGLTYTNLNQETAGFVTGKDSYKDRDIAESNPEPEAFRDAWSLRAWSRLAWELEGERQWVVTPYIRATEMDFLQHFLPGDPLEENVQQSIGIQSAYYSLQDEGYLQGFAPAAGADGDSEADVFGWIIGLDAEYTRGYLTEFQSVPAEGSAFLQETVPQGLHYDYEVAATMVAPFAHGEWRPTAALKLTAGLRYERMSYDYDNKMLSGRSRDDGTECGFGGCRYSRPADRRDNFGNWSPKLSLGFRLAADHLLYASLARGFRAPQATELYRLQREQTMADLDSERVNSFEIGFKGNFSPFNELPLKSSSSASLRYAIAAYAMKKDNYIFRDSDFFNVSDGQTLHRGIELELAYRLNRAFDIALSASYARHSYDYEEVLNGIDIDGNDVDTAPRYFSNTRLGWNFSAAGRLELEWIDMGSYYLEPENTHKYPGHNLLNLKLSWSPDRRWTLYGRLNNLADKAYAERADYTSFTEERYFPGTPLTLFVGVKWQL